MDVEGILLAAADNDGFVVVDGDMALVDRLVTAGLLRPREEPDGTAGHELTQAGWDAARRAAGSPRA